MGIISTIICGAIIGIVAKFIMPGKNEPQGFILTAILGIVGAYVGSLLPLGGEAGGLMWWVQSIVGALILLVVYHLVMNRQNA
jgi:uncharacterized membrane protein YeaQ/YmgE (transglycosylase-associated protein family)